MARLLGVAFSLCLLAGVVRAELPVEPVGRVESLPSPPRAHWAWVFDMVLGRSALLDLDRGEFLGMVSTGFLSNAAVFPREGGAFYLPETYYSRGTRGERTDVVTFYDAGSLAPLDEVVIPPKRAINVLTTGNASLSDDGRFLAVFNMTPATSLSVVDVRERRLAGEISTPGCSLVYAAGPRRFMMLCTDGALLTVTLDERGGEASKQRGQPFFDPERDPVTEKAVRVGDTWIFVSFEGIVHPVDVSGASPAPLDTWSLLSDADRARSWRVGGMQQLAVHEKTQRLYALVHRGGEHSHKAPGSELWVYDLTQRERVQRVELHNPGISIMSETIEFGRDWPAPFSGTWDWMLDHLAPNPGIGQIAVTPDAAPLLVTGSQIGGSVGVYDALTGELLRRVSSGNLTTHTLQTPWGAGARR
jgi:methylamine dehydrogenase heavy chain